MSPPDMVKWTRLASAVDEVTTPVRIAIVGKYTGLQDSYLSVIKVRIGTVLVLSHRARLTCFVGVNGRNLFSDFTVSAMKTLNVIQQHAVLKSCENITSSSNDLLVSFSSVSTYWWPSLFDSLAIWRLSLRL